MPELSGFDMAYFLLSFFGGMISYNYIDKKVNHGTN